MQQEISILKIPKKDLKRIREKQLVNQSRKKHYSYKGGGKKARKLNSFLDFEEES